ncbi:hypothetical protein L596_027188 [Steinernema carpocapsae]|uniref:Uncharacterized protein n=1 Tax=Steinernema carpocapsae TaxID=34508 RepID=A0A4U5M3K8_STECR|nr:hypothetical protein L596_027188 [Steinernema carpocapsae]
MKFVLFEFIDNVYRSNWSELIELVIKPYSNTADRLDAASFDLEFYVFCDSNEDAFLVESFAPSNERFSKDWTKEEKQTWAYTITVPRTIEIELSIIYGIKLQCVKVDKLEKPYLATTEANPSRGIQWIEGTEFKYMLKFVSGLKLEKPLPMIWKMLSIFVNFFTDSVYFDVLLLLSSIMKSLL